MKHVIGFCVSVVVEMAERIIWKSINLAWHPLSRYSWAVVLTCMFEKAYYSKIEPQHLNLDLNRAIIILDIKNGIRTHTFTLKQPHAILSSHRQYNIPQPWRPSTESSPAQPPNPTAQNSSSKTTPLTSTTMASSTSNRETLKTRTTGRRLAAGS